MLGTLIATMMRENLWVQMTIIWLLFLTVCDVNFRWLIQEHFNVLHLVTNMPQYHIFRSINKLHVQGHRNILIISPLILSCHGNTRWASIHLLGSLPLNLYHLYEYDFHTGIWIVICFIFLHLTTNLSSINI